MLKAEELSCWAVETSRVILQADFFREAVWPGAVGLLKHLQQLCSCVCLWLGLQEPQERGEMVLGAAVAQESHQDLAMGSFGWSPKLSEW